MKVDDLYSVFGVAPTASSADIKARYRFLCHAYHPDKFPTEEQREAAANEFKKIHAAFKVLSDPSARAHYDASRADTAQKAHSKAPGSAPTPPKAQPAPPVIKANNADSMVPVLMFLSIILVFLICFFYFNGRTLSQVDRSKAVAISPEDLEISNISFKPKYESEERQVFSARVRNGSTKAIKEISIRIGLKDTTDGTTEIVGEEIVVAKVNIPSLQTRQITQDIYFFNLPAKSGVRNWYWSIVKIE